MPLRLEIELLIYLIFLNLVPFPFLSLGESTPFLSLSNFFVINLLNFGSGKLVSLIATSPSGSADARLIKAGTHASASKTLTISSPPRTRRLLFLVT